MRQVFKSQKGLTLLEILIAIVILGVITAAIARAFLTGMSLTARSGANELASAKASSLAENAFSGRVLRRFGAEVGIYTSSGALIESVSDANVDSNESAALTIGYRGGAARSASVPVRLYKITAYAAEGLAELNVAVPVGTR